MSSLRGPTLKKTKIPLPVILNHCSVDHKSSLKFSSLESSYILDEKLYKASKFENFHFIY